jgi:hypothetical protein
LHGLLPNKFFKTAFLYSAKRDGGLLFHAIPNGEPIEGKDNNNDAT